MKMSELIESLAILVKYGDSEVNAEHDQIWAGPDDVKKVLSKEDWARLEHLRWFEDEDDGSYSHFV